MMVKRVGVFLMMLWLTLSLMGQTVVSDITDGMPRGCRRDMLLKQHTMVKTRRVSATRHTDAYTGNRRQLVVLAAFADLKFMQNDPMPVWNRIFNEVGYHEGSYVGSVHDYFYDQSYHHFNLTFDLLYVEVPGNRVKYRSTDYDDENSKYFINDIVDVLLTRDIDWSPYDWDGDGEIDQLLVVYAGKGMNIDGDKNTIWPHQWWLSEHENCQPRTVSSGGKDYLVDAYCVVMETANSYDVYTSFGTLCHEYSHCFGLPDFYYGGTSVVRSWDLMDYGCYNGQSFCPCNYSAHERMYMGWLTPTELHPKTSVTDMAALDIAPVAYLVRNDGWSDEYYIIENRQQRGWDTDLPGSGVIIAHVDFDEQVWRYGVANESKDNLRYHIFPANNKSVVSNLYNLKGWPYPYESDASTNNALTNQTVPAAKVRHQNVDGTLFMSKPITNINVADGRASFDFMPDETGIEEVNWNPDEMRAVYNLQGQRLTLPVRGINIVGGKKILVK